MVREFRTNFKLNRIRGLSLSHSLSPMTYVSSWFGALGRRASLGPLTADSASELDVLKIEIVRME